MATLGPEVSVGIEKTIDAAKRLCGKIPVGPRKRQLGLKNISVDFVLCHADLTSALTDNRCCGNIRLRGLCWRRFNS